MSDMPTHPIRFADLPARKRSHFKIEPDAAGRKALAEAIDVLKIPKLRFEGALIPTGKRDWRIEATLGATVSQACVVTLDPVTTRIDEDITRAFAVELDIPDEDEFEIGEDDSADPLPDTLDLVDVLAEALVLAMPAYPRKDGVQADVTSVTEPGKAVMTDEDARPFAGLAALRAGLENKDGTDA
ncbi:MAG: DUF177 domain-containing protein [Octadecabacter sp.]|nr:DUF177 domain-containing protein [Octadecabacter sp.]